MRPAGQAAAEVLTTGLTLGENPRKIAGELRQAVGLGLTRALRISRTEVLRSYREATRRNYQANSDVVQGWIWHAHVTGPGSERTCAACWGMHGSKHTLDERLDDHICGRCAMLPQLPTWAELGAAGFADADVTIPTGPALFAQLPAAAQDRILGKAAGAAYRAGVVKLEDFVGQKQSVLWGTTRYVRSLREVVGAEEAAKWVRLSRNSDVLPAFIRAPKFASVSDAERWAHDELGVSVSYGGHAKIAEITNRALAALAEQKYDLPTIEVSAAKFDAARELYRAKYGETPQDAIAMYWEGKVYVDPRDTYWDNPESSARRLKQSGLWSTGEIEHPIWHEVGHAQHERHLQKLWRRIGKFVPGQAQIAFRVSDYAALGPKEFVAEVFAAIIAGKTPLDDPDVARLFRQWGW